MNNNHCQITDVLTSLSENTVLAQQAQNCVIYLYVVCCGRAVPLLWKVLEHQSSTVAFNEYKIILRLAERLLSKYPDIMLLADRGFANCELIA